MIQSFLFASYLIIVISLVWGATHHERMPQILGHAVAFGLSVFAGMGVVLLLLILWPIIGTAWILVLIIGTVFGTSIGRRLYRRRVGVRGDTSSTKNG